RRNRDVTHDPQADRDDDRTGPEYLRLALRRDAHQSEERQDEQAREHGTHERTERFTETVFDPRLFDRQQAIPNDDVLRVEEVRPENAQAEHQLGDVMQRY